jgi:hypothetical protein
MKMSPISRNCRSLFLSTFILIGTAAILPAKWLTIHNDFNVYDTDGDPIRTRSGDLDKFGETYYWYGCGQRMTNQTCYSSDDLLHWKNEGVMLEATRGTNRMDVVYNDSTDTYVMVMKWETEGTDDWCKRGIATSPSPTGPYTYLFDSLVYGVHTGDMSVFKDDDGKAYYLYELWDNGRTSQGFSLMTSDYIGLEKKMQQWSNSDREANMMMKNHGIYYYMTSKMMGIDPSETQYWTAPAIDGPWTTRLVPVIAPGDADRKSWDTQCDFVFPFKGTEDTVQMYCGDRWKRPHAARGGDYVWLPITFTPRDSVVINYYQDWEVDPDRGLWRPIDDERNLARNKAATASSESGSNTAAKATDPSTWQNYLNSRWVSGSGDPQWISVDLGSPVKVNRVILKWDSSYAESFKIQVSTDNSEWEDVFSTTKGRPRTITDETFETVTARYVRMYATAMGGSSGGCSLFDFMVLNDTGVTTSTIQHSKTPVPAIPLLTSRGNIIQYTVSSCNPVKIDVVDSRGKRVAVLVDGYKIAGNHESVLPGTLSRGMYVIRMTAGAEKRAIRKIVL